MVAAFSRAWRKGKVNFQPPAKKWSRGKDFNLQPTSPGSYDIAGLFAPVHEQSE